MKGNLYNKVHGENPLADKLLKMLTLQRSDFGRYRDIYVTDAGGTVTVYTRIGGRNRPYFAEEMRKLGMHPDIMSAWDDEFDDTYHYVKFRVVNHYLPKTTKMYAVQGDPLTIHKMFEKTNAEMASMTAEQLMTDPRFAETAKLMAELAKPGAPPVIRFYDEDTPRELRV